MPVREDREKLASGILFTLGKVLIKSYARSTNFLFFINYLIKIRSAVESSF